MLVLISGQCIRLLRLFWGCIATICPQEYIFIFKSLCLGFHMLYFSPVKLSHVVSACVLFHLEIDSLLHVQRSSSPVQALLALSLQLSNSKFCSQIFTVFSRRCCDTSLTKQNSKYEPLVYFIY